MTKTDKLLYGGFAVVAIGGIVAMLMSVFSPQKQKAKETVETPQIEQKTMETASPVDEIIPPAGYVAYWLDDDGNKVWLTQEEVDEGLAAAEEQKGKEAEQKAKEKEWWESRKEWIERFPFQPTHHPKLTYDPNVYDPSNLPPQEERDADYREMRDLARLHSFLRNFYESRLPYTEEFEQMYDIAKEELGEKADNSFVLGWTFEHLKDYHQAKRKDPEAIYQKNVREALPPPPFPTMPSLQAGLTPEQRAAFKTLSDRERRAMTAELRASRDRDMMEKIQAHRESLTSEIVDVTWGKRTEVLKESILADLLWRVHDSDSEHPWISRDQATTLRDRLVNEIPAEGFWEMPESGLTYIHRYELELKQGDSLLVK